MTDLPRFHKGSVGELTFDTVNEMMRRLDILLPLVQSAASGGGWTGKERPMVFPVYAERTEETTELGHYKYNWWEVTLVGYTCGFTGDNQTDTGDTQLRGGGGAVLPMHPRKDDPDPQAFLNGFAIAFAIRSGNTQSPDGGVQILLFPYSVPNAGPGYCKITGEPIVGSVMVGTDSRTVQEYPAPLYQSSPDTSGESVLEVVNEDVTLVDLNSSFVNEPTITGSDTTLTPRIYNTGTIFMATKIGEARYAFTHLVRFDVTCT